MSARVAVLDSGIHAGHPHVNRVAGGFNATASGAAEDWLDFTGHGTAVAGAIQSHAPECELLAVKIFDRALRTDLDTIERGVRWALAQGAHFINLSLGATNAEHIERLRALVAEGGIWVSAAESDGKIYYPGSLEGVYGVVADPSLARDVYRELSPGRYAASPFPRDIPGVPREQNLHGISFAVANLTGLLARDASRRA
jgi:hypothetical protein